MQQITREGKLVPESGLVYLARARGTSWKRRWGKMADLVFRK